MNNTWASSYTVVVQQSLCSLCGRIFPPFWHNYPRFLCSAKNYTRCIRIVRWAVLAQLPTLLVQRKELHKMHKDSKAGRFGTITHTSCSAQRTIQDACG